MSNGVNKCLIFTSYLEGNSIPEVSKLVGMPRSTVRYRLKSAGVLRTIREGIQLAAKKGLMSRNKGGTVQFTKEWIENIRKGKLRHGELHAKGTSLKPSGYIEITRGEHKGRGQHVVIMEQVIGRSLVAGECVHHKNSVRDDNRPENLQVMTRAEHTRLHSKTNYKDRKLDNKGRFVK